MNEKMNKKPRVRFCWVCGNKLWGNKHAVVLGPDGYERITHKQCKKEASKQLQLDIKTI